MDADDNQGSASKKRIQYKSYDPELMEKAMGAVQKDGKTIYRAAKEYGVPMNTLRDRLVAKGIIQPKRPSCSEKSTLAKPKGLSKERSIPGFTSADDTLERWRDIGKAEGLTGNAAITRFLVSLYFQAEKASEGTSDKRCLHCQNPLTLFCVNCRLISQSTHANQKEMPSQVTGSETPGEDVKPSPTDSNTKARARSIASPPQRRSSRGKKLTKSQEIKKTRSHETTKVKPKVDVASSDDEQSGLEVNFLTNDWSQIDNSLTVEDPIDAKDDPAFSLDVFLVSVDEDEGEETHKRPKIKTFECPQCEQSFTDSQLLRDHFEETKHITKYVCRQCKKPFQNKSALRQHSRVHNRHAHQCTTCGLSFKFPSRLSKHIKTHGTDKSHVCDKCGKCFVSVYYLRDHIKIHSEERRYKCELCDAAFKQKPALYAHGKKHTKAKPFQCQYCGLKFRDSQKLKIHVRTHTGEKPYKCGMCDASFVSNSNMWQHCAYVHGKSTKTHPCALCPLTFAAKGKLKVHMKNTHGDSSKGVEEGVAEEGVGEEEDGADTNQCTYDMMQHPMYIELLGENLGKGGPVESAPASEVRGCGPHPESGHNNFLPPFPSPGGGYKCESFG